MIVFFVLYFPFLYFFCTTYILECYLATNANIFIICSLKINQSINQSINKNIINNNNYYYYKNHLQF